MDYSAELLQTTCAKLGIAPEGLVLHADNGWPMKGSTILETQNRLGIVVSLSRPSVSDGTTYSEELICTQKYRNKYPIPPLDSIEKARTWRASFVASYNDEHLYSSIGFVTPSARHLRRDEAICTRRLAGGIQNDGVERRGVGIGSRSSASTRTQ